MTTKESDLITEIAMRFYKGVEVLKIFQIGLKIREHYMSHKINLKMCFT